MNCCDTKYVVRNIYTTLLVFLALIQPIRINCNICSIVNLPVSSHLVSISQEPPFSSKFFFSFWLRDGGKLDDMKKKCFFLFSLLSQIHGTVLNITSFLALWMEHSCTEKVSWVNIEAGCML